MSEAIPNTPGVYAIRHEGTGRLYIGSSKRLKDRWDSHVKKLRASKHANCKLQRSWLKHGEAAFAFTVVQMVEHDHEVVFWEQFWIDTLKPYYNIALVAGSTLGVKLSEEAIRLRTIQRTGEKRTEQTKQNIRLALVGKPKPAEARKQMSLAKSTPEARARIIAQKARTYLFVSPAGEAVSIYNMSEFSRVNGLHGGMMSLVACGKRNHHKGWRLATKENGS